MTFQIRALAALAAGTILAASAPAATIFSADFNNFTNGQFAATQYGTGLPIYASGDVVGWPKSTQNHTIHAVERGPGDFALMFYDLNVMFYGTPLAANTLGQSYTVSFDGATAVYTDPNQATGPDGYLDIRINDANGIVSSFHYNPISSAFAAASFTYTGTGTGDIYLLIKDGIDDDNRFGGAIDNIVLAETPAAVPEPASWALMLAGFGAIGGALRRRTRVAIGFG